MFKSMDIADYFVVSSLHQNIKINNLKLQKLLYYFYAKNLVDGQDNPFDEKFEMWQYGPVLPSVYHSYKQFGGFSITELPSHYRFDNTTNGFEKYTFVDSKLSEDLKMSIDKFVKSFEKYSPFELVERTHRHKEWKKNESLINMGMKNLVYDDKLTKEYFDNNIGEQLWN